MISGWLKRQSKIKHNKFDCKCGDQLIKETESQKKLTVKRSETDTLNKRRFEKLSESTFMELNSRNLDI